MNWQFLRKKSSSPGIPWKYVLALSVCWVLSVALTASTLLPLKAAPSLEQLQQQLQERQDYYQDVSQESDRLQNLEKAALDRLQALQENIEKTGIKLHEIDSQLLEVSQLLKQSQLAVRNSQIAYQESVTAAIARLRFLQRQPKSYGLAILLASENFNDFLRRRHQLKRVYQADRQTLLRLKGQLDRLDRQKINIEQIKNEIALIRQQLLAQQANFTQQAQVQQQLVQRLQTDRQALQAAQIRLKRDSTGIALLIQQRVATSNLPQNRNPAQMIVPNNGNLSSSFGWRQHPLWGYRVFHAGIDFAADYGSLISAAHAGVVIFAGWYGGYGNTVIIDRGGGVTTLYAHASELYVREGQTVQQGQAIATVGSTGFSTGPHLHFEVRERGQPVDPINYLL